MSQIVITMLYYYIYTIFTIILSGKKKKKKTPFTVIVVNCISEFSGILKSIWFLNILQIVCQTKVLVITIRKHIEATFTMKALYYYPNYYVI